MVGSRGSSLFGRNHSRRIRKSDRRRKRRSRQSVKALQALEPRLLLAVTTSISDGDWLDSSTWDNGVPDATTRAIIAQNTTVQLDGYDHIAEEIVVHGTLNVPESIGGGGSGSSDPTQLGDGRLKVYHNGALAGTTQGSQLWSHPGGNAFGGVNGSTRTHTGNQSESTDVLFGGRIDDIINYNRALIADELSGIFTRGRNQVHLAPTDGMAAVWKFGPNGSLEDFATGDAVDDAGTFVGGAPPTSGSNLLLDGINERVDVAASTDINTGIFVEKTISLWFKVDQTTGRQVIYEQGGGTRGLNIYLEGDTLYAGGWNDTASQSAWAGDWITVENIGTGIWHHVALVLDGDAPTSGSGSGSTPLNGGTKTLETRWMHVNSDGVFQIGTSNDRYDEGKFELTLTGTDPDSDHIVDTASGMINIDNNDGFLMTAGGGSLQIYGAEKLSFTKLSSSVNSGATQITVENVIERNFTEGNTLPGGDFETSAADDGELNWQVGDDIVIASSSHNYREEDVRTITAITDNGDGTTTLTLDMALAHDHYGEIEQYSNSTRSWEIDMRAEVGLLSRNILIQGTEGQDTDSPQQDVNAGMGYLGDRARENIGTAPELDLHNGRQPTGNFVDDVTNGVGAHTMIMEGSGPITVDGVQMDLMGQAGRLGRYPIHWHVAHDRTGDVLRNSSITNSNNRGVTIHGTQNVEIEGVLLHDVHGHGFFFEDGVETGNKLTANIAFGIHRVGRKLLDDNFNQDDNYYDPFTVDLHDDVFVKGNRGVLSAAFWVTNANNDFIGNVTAGSQGMGFWYVAAETALGASGQLPRYQVAPWNEPFKAPMGRNEYSTLHSAGTGFGLGEPGNNPPSFTEFTANTFNGVAEHMTSYKNHVGTWVETEIDFNGYLAADNHVQFRSFDELEMRNSLIVGDSIGNADGNYDPFNRNRRQLAVTGLGLYREGINVVDTHFAGFEGDDAYLVNFQMNDGNNRHGSSFRGITYEGNNQDDQLKATPALALPRQVDDPVDDQGYLYDVDGSLTGNAGTTLVFRNRFLYATVGNLGGDEIIINGEQTNLFKSDKTFGKLSLRAMNNANNAPAATIRSGAGINSQFTRTNAFEHVVMLDDGDLRITIPTPRGSWNSGIRLDLSVDTDAGTPAGASTFVELVDVPSGLQLTNATLRSSKNAARNAGNSSYFVDSNGTYWVKIFANDGKVLQFN